MGTLKKIIQKYSHNCKCFTIHEKSLVLFRKNREEYMCNITPAWKKELKKLEKLSKIT